MHRPEFIDNLDGNTLADAIARVLDRGSGNQGLSEAGAQPSRLDIASAFFSPAGFAAIADALDDLERIRLMVEAKALYGMVEGRPGVISPRHHYTAPGVRVRAPLPFPQFLNGELGTLGVDGPRMDIA